MQNNFGEELQNLRKKRNMTLEEVSTITNYSVKRIRELEKNNGLPSVDLLNQLSSCYKANLNVYFSTSELNFPPYVLAVFPEFKCAIENFDIKHISDLVNRYTDDSNFTSGEGLKLLLYCKGLIKIDSNDFDSAKEIYEQAFAIDNLDIKNILEDNIYYSYTTFNILISYAFVCFYVNDTETTGYILKNLDFVFKNNYFNDESLFMYSTEYMIRLFLKNSNNLAVYYLKTQRPNEALNIINPAITFCQKHFKIKFLIILFSTKMEVLCYLQDFENARLIADAAINFFKITEDFIELEKYIKYLKATLPTFHEMYQFS